MNGRNQLHWDIPEVDGPTDDDNRQLAFDEFLRTTAEEFGRAQVPGHGLSFHAHEWRLWKAAWAANNRLGAQIEQLAEVRDFGPCDCRRNGVVGRRSGHA